jgi:putative cardiolipin synthase
VASRAPGAVGAAGDGADADEVSAIAMLDRPEEALVSRLALIDLAERSIDVQTYCWYGDRVGRLLAERLLRAADRGVRVRVLLDDLDGAGRDLSIALFDAGPNVEVRLYNPFRIRFGSRLLRPVELLLNLDRLDHRMHNKTFVVDNQAAVIGGRNIAEEYFGLNERFNYRDFDVLALGEAARQVSDGFDAYWADARSYPVWDVAPHEFRPEELAAARVRLADFAATWHASGAFPYRAPGGRDETLVYVTGLMRGAVVARTEFLFDDPRKGDIHAEQPSRIREVLTRTRPTSEVVVINPYFVPQERLVAAMVAQRERGVSVRVLTNSLASTDVVPVHGGYAKRRKELLRGGVELYELRADAESRTAHAAATCPRATLSLHGKAMVIDRARVFVGSMNLDPRSHRLNTEDGILVHSAELARQVGERLDVEFRATNAWRVTLDDRGRLGWTTSDARGWRECTNEPDTSLWRRIKCDLCKLLPIEEEL